MAPVRPWRNKEGFRSLSNGAAARRDRGVLADVVSLNIPADVVSFTLGQALPLITGTTPERADLYRRLFARAGSAGIDVPLWREVVGTLQQLVGVVLLFMIGLALRNRFRMK